MSTTRAVRKDMWDWSSSHEGGKWSVMLDVRDLGGHIETTFRGWPVTLAARVRTVISRMALFSVFLLDLHGRILVVSSMFIPVHCMALRLHFWLGVVHSGCVCC